MDEDDTKDITYNEPPDEKREEAAAEMQDGPADKKPSEQAGVSRGEDKGGKSEPKTLSQEEIESRRPRAKEELSGKKKTPPKSIKKDSHTKMREKATSAHTAAKEKEVGRKEEVATQKPRQEKAAEKKIPATETVTAREDKKKLRPIIRTIRSDITKAVEKDKLSLAQIAIYEQERRRKAEQVEYVKERRKKGIATVAISVLLIASGVFIINYFGIFRQEPSPQIVTRVETSSLIFSDEELVIDTTGAGREKLFGTIHESLKESDFKKGDVVNLVLFKKIVTFAKQITTQDFFTMLDTNAPGILLRALDGTFMLGAYVDATENIFLIVTGDSFENTFAGLIAWEEYMPDDLSGLMIEAGAGAEDAGWHDVVVKNVSSRVYEQADKVILIYAFLDKKTVLIAPNKATFAEALGRFQTPKEVTR